MEKRSISINGDLLMAISVVGVLIVMVIPLPPLLLDLLLSFSITFSLIILLVSMYTLQPLEFSVFPSLLLVVTLFRLSLNVASTRLILLHGNEGVAAAGQVIKAFGNFVVGGNYLVGLIVFLILVVINFVVITKGAGRIAEVAARFTLDAMPGKQMSIDADLNAGLITDVEARERRKRVAEEADFYGAMDGASKFVRGDAIAGLIITLINILGGLVIGIFYKGMNVSHAAQTYTLLTIGDGLVAQIPALIVSTAAGIIVTRAASETNLGNEMLGQLIGHPRALTVAAIIILLLGLLPGLPTFPFILLAGSAGVASYSIARTEQKSGVGKDQAGGPKGSEMPEPEKPESLLTLDYLGLEVGYGLIPLVDMEQGGELLERIKSLRKQYALEMGFIIPPVHLKDNLQLKPGGYSILLRGIEIAKGELMLNHLLAIDPGVVEEQIDIGIPTKEPVFGLPALWIPEKDKERAQFAGYTVVDGASIIATHLSEIIKGYAHELLGRQEVQNLLDNLAQSYPKPVEELVPKLLTLGAVQRVLQNLLREGVSIRDLLSIVETLADYAPLTKDPEVLTEYVRQKLARSICHPYQSAEGTITVMTLDSKLEEQISEAIHHTEQGSYLALEPRLAQAMLIKIKEEVEKFQLKGLQPIILCSPIIRSHLRKLTERYLPKLVVLSHNEIAENLQIQSLGNIRLENED
jgi:flagellar biosynthesis protein FlhA